MTHLEEAISSNVSNDQQKYIAACVARQNAKRERINKIKQSMTDKHNEQTRFYFLMFKVSLVLCIVILIGCLIAAESAKHKLKTQLQTEALMQQLEHGEAVEMTVRVGGRE